MKKLPTLSVDNAIPGAASPKEWKWGCGGMGVEKEADWGRASPPSLPLPNCQHSVTSCLTVDYNLSNHEPKTMFLFLCCFFSRHLSQQREK